jgi:hypothetical protein
MRLGNTVLIMLLALGTAAVVFGPDAQPGAPPPRPTPRQPADLISALWICRQDVASAIQAYWTVQETRADCERAKAAVPPSVASAQQRVAQECWPPLELAFQEVETAKGFFDRATRTPATAQGRLMDDGNRHIAQAMAAAATATQCLKRAQSDLFQSQSKAPPSGSPPGPFEPGDPDPGGPPAPIPPPRHAPKPRSPAPQRTCRDQVQVTSFQARVRGPLEVGVDPWNANNLILDTAKDGQPGITFTAMVTIRTGAVPLDHLHLRYIQNKTAFTGAMVYAPPPHLIPVLRDGSTLPPHAPLLDRPDASDSRLPLPFYPGQFQETPPTGVARQITASDSPGTAVQMTRHNGTSAFQSIHLTSTYRMFLVCVDGRSGALEVLRQLEWTVLYKGTFNTKSRLFTPDPAAGITAQPSGSAHDTPVRQPPLSNVYSTYKEQS